jgi:GH25 family lysozyme M1 (1,4-beta-N-acetylmuramidase)
MARAKIADFSWWQFAEREYDENGNEIVVLDMDNIDFVAMKEAGFDGVILRASHGWRVDESFELAYELAKDAGLLVGAYHYIYVDSGNNQWTVFWGEIEDKDLELGFFFDQEVHSNTDATASEWQTVINANTAGMVSVTDEDPGFYTSYWMWPLTGPMYMINGKPTKDYTLWVANWHYDFEEEEDPAVPEPWDIWEYWQQTSMHQPDWNTAYNNNTDVGVFNGTPEQFHAKYGDGDPIPDPDPDPDPPAGSIVIQYSVEPASVSIDFQEV